MYFTQEDYIKIQEFIQRNSIKDSDFNEAHPLDGSETVTIVQNKQNRKVFLRDLVDQMAKFDTSDFLNINDKYKVANITLEEAIRYIPTKARKEGQIITFSDTDNNWHIYQFRGSLNQWNNLELWEDLFDWEKLIIDSILPDEEDLTKSLPDENGNSYLSLKDREYKPEDFSGLGRVVLRKNIVEVEYPIYGKVKKNILYQDMFTQSNTIYEIRYDFDLNGNEITIPEGCVLDFQGGSLSNGIVKGKLNCSVCTSNIKTFDILASIECNEIVLDSIIIVDRNTSFKSPIRAIYGGVINCNKDYYIEFNGFNAGLFYCLNIEGNLNLININKIYPEWFGAKGDGINDDTKPLQNSFKFAKDNIIHLSKNKIYNIRKGIQVYSNTEIIFDGTILCIGNGCLEFFDRNIEQPGYTGVHDVYIHGCGSFDCNGHNIENTASAFRIHHCRNITIEDITIKNWFRYHAMEIGGSKNVIIRNITINNAYGQKNDENATAIQVERCSEAGTVGAIPYDYTITKDVSIIGCTFTCTDSQYGYTAIESHDKIFDSEQQDENSFSNIIIKDCTFKNIPILPGLQPLISFDSNFKDVRIESNIFDNVYDNILFIGRYCNNININNNIFRNTYKGIVQIGSGVETNSKYIVISNNKILNCSKDLSPSIYIARKADFLIIEHNYVELYNEESSKPFHMPSTGNSESIIFKDNFISNATILTEEALKDLHEQLSRFEYKSENSAMGRNYTNYFTDIPKMTTKGSTANRPKSWSKGGILSNNDDIGIGFMYFDTDLGKPVYVKSITSNGVIWVDATGADV